MLIMQIMHEASWASLGPCHRPADILRRGAPALQYLHHVTVTLRLK